MNQSKAKEEGIFPKVVIFMATYNSQTYLAAQLDSIVSQSYKHWKICVSDDGSTDHTLQILETYQKQLGETKLEIYQGPQQGYAANFMSLIHKKDSLKDFDADYYAYSDHDDIWHSDKLERAMEWFKKVSTPDPALYCSRTQLIDESGNAIGYSTLFTKKPSFLNALVQCLGGGNTMVFDRSTLSLLQQVPQDIQLVAHDWWTYLLVTGVGGTVHYDSHPTIGYRQHSVNLLGSNLGLSACFHRLLWIIQGRFKSWNDLNYHALCFIKQQFTEENRASLELFSATRQAGLLTRLLNMKRLGIYRQTWLGNIGLFFTILLKKI